VAAVDQIGRCLVVETVRHVDDRRCRIVARGQICSREIAERVVVDKNDDGVDRLERVLATNVERKRVLGLVGVEQRIVADDFDAAFVECRGDIGALSPKYPRRWPCTSVRGAARPAPRGCSTLTVRYRFRPLYRPYPRPRPHYPPVGGDSVA